jgi:hypothetical protein
LPNGPIRIRRRPPDFLKAAAMRRGGWMEKESLLKFVGTGMVVLPVILLIGTGSLDAIALSLFVLLMLMLGVLMVNPDDPVGDKMRADARDEDDSPQ